MKNSYEYLHLFIGIGLLFAATSFVKAVSNSESCSTSNVDGKCVGSEASDGDESQNFCKIEEMGSNNDKDEFQQLLKEVGEDMNSLEMEIVMSFMDTNHDRIISQPEFEKILYQRPDLVVGTLLKSFSYLDVDDADGIITIEDLQEALGNSVDTEKLALISSDLDNLPEGQLTIHEFIKPLTRLGIIISTALTPFLSLDHLPTLKAKSAVARNLRQFKEADVDNNGILSKDEFSSFTFGFESFRANKQTLFAFIDKNKDYEIQFTEFQIILPRKPKYRKEYLENIFKLIDTNKDGFVTEKELRIHLVEPNKLLNIPIRNDNEIDQTFAKLDVDKDEKLSFEEMKALIEEIVKKCIESFIELDADLDMQLSEEEMIALAKQIEERTNQPIDPDFLIKMIDKDDDDIVTIEEWHDHIFLHPQQP